MEALAPEDVVHQVQALLQRRRIGQARLLLKPALAVHPDHTGLLLQAAWTDYLDDEYDEALATVRQVLVSEPDDQSARLLYFELLLELDQPVDAERVIIDLLREFPEHAHYYGRYAQLMLKSLKLSKARQLAQEGIKYDPGDSECLTALTICDFIEQRAGATSHGLQQLLVRDPQSIRTLSLVLIALQQRGDLQGASRVSQELVRAQPDNEHVVSVARQLKTATHWSLLPLWPVQRYGWGGSFAVWIIAVIGLRMVRSVDPDLGNVLAIVFLVYVAYSWIWPPLLRRLLRT